MRTGSHGTLGSLTARNAGPYGFALHPALRLSVYQHAHLNVHGHYSFVLPDLAGGRRPLRNPDVAPHA